MMNVCVYCLIYVTVQWLAMYGIWLEDADSTADNEFFNAGDSIKQYQHTSSADSLIKPAPRVKVVY